MIDKADLIETILYKYAQGVTFNNASKGEAINITHLKPIIDLFVEQACEAIEPLKKTSCDSAGYISDSVQIMNRYYEKAQQEIRDKFK